MSLAPNFVLWALICFTLLLIAGAIAWLVLHDPLVRLLRHLWLADLAAAWLAYAAGYHLAFLPAWRLVLGRPLAVWTLCGALALYLALRRLPTPLRRPEALFALAVLTWAGVIAAGFRYVEQTAADAALLAERPAAVVTTAAPDLRPLRRALLLTRIDAPTRQATADVLSMLEGAAPADPALLAAYRLSRVPRLLDFYRRDLVKLRTYQWLQTALLAVLLLLWGYGRVPDWEALPSRR